MFSDEILQIESVSAAFGPASLAAGTIAGSLADRQCLKGRGGVRGRVCGFVLEDGRVAHVRCFKSHIRHL